MFAFQALGFGIQFSEVQQLVDEFQQVVGVLLYMSSMPFRCSGWFSRNSSSGLIISDKGVRSS